MNIAVIDNWISPIGVLKRTGKTISVMRVCEEGCAVQMTAGSTNSHGTICSSILAESMPEPASLVGYSCSKDDEKAQIQKVCRALEDCLNNPPACISMSIGSENWLETKELGVTTKKLADAGTQIYAACANKGCIAFPAAYPWVTGVRYVPGTVGLYREENSLVGNDVIVGEFTTPILRKLASENSFFECRTNSMATPYALGTMISKGMKVSDLPQWEGSSSPGPIEELPMPTVALRGPLEQMMELLSLLKQERYQAALLTDRVQTDWTNMILHASAEDFLRWVKPLKEAGILLLDIEGGLASIQKYGDYLLNLEEVSVEIGYSNILQFFGTESE
ncbi:MULTISPECIES: hypothetical protein [Acutalibacter]|uniref:hypothetical protein n=1 Tax=Acutalibacter TaxID=1918385 RepID=UPI00272ED46B|nr:hypothetical protein [Acutalibacter muris]